MAHDIFIRLSGIEGESQDFKHRGEIEVLRWRWIVSQPSNMHNGSGGGLGKCIVEDLCFDHYIDKASPVLLNHCLTGKHIPEATFTIRKVGGLPLDYLRLSLQDVIITQVRPVGLNTMRMPREKIALSFARIKMDYISQNKQGAADSQISSAYDIKANRII